MNWHRDISKHIESIFQESNQTFSQYQTAMGLNCLNGCGACCLSKDVCASVLEMLPTAFRLIDERGIDACEVLLNDLIASEEKVCIFYKRTSEDGRKGHCTNYNTRPSICRSFGAAAMKNKLGEKTMSICKVIKDAYPEKIKDLNPNEAPTIGDFAKRILLLDPNLGTKLLPINEALKEALLRALSSSYFDLSRWREESL